MATGSTLQATWPRIEVPLSPELLTPEELRGAAVADVLVPLPLDVAEPHAASAGSMTKQIPADSSLMNPTPFNLVSQFDVSVAAILALEDIYALIGSRPIKKDDGNEIVFPQDRSSTCACPSRIEASVARSSAVSESSVSIR